MEFLVDAFSVPRSFTEAYRMCTYKCKQTNSFFPLFQSLLFCDSARKYKHFEMNEHLLLIVTRGKRKMGKQSKGIKNIISAAFDWAHSKRLFTFSLETLIMVLRLKQKKIWWRRNFAGRMEKKSNKAWAIFRRD